MQQWDQLNQETVKIGNSTNNIKINYLGFADDLACLAESVKEARHQITTLESIAYTIGLKISYEKLKL